MYHIAMSNEKKSKYDQKYMRDNVMSFRFQINRKTEPDILEWFNQQPNRNGYLKRLIREDMERSVFAERECEGG